MRNAPLAILESDETSSTIDDDAIFSGLLLAVIGRRRLLVLVGECPDDRMALLARLAHHIAADGSMVLTVTASSGITVEDLVEVAGRTLLGRSGAALGFDDVVVQLESHLDQAGTGILMIEDADKLPVETLRDLADLSGSLSGQGCFLQILLAGGAQLDHRLEQADLLPMVRAVGTLYRLERAGPGDTTPPLAPDLPAPSLPAARSAPRAEVPFPPPGPGERPVLQAQRRAGLQQVRHRRSHGLLWFGLAATCLTIAGTVMATRDRTDLLLLAQQYGLPLSTEPATSQATPPAAPLATTVPIRPSQPAAPLSPEERPDDMTVEVSQAPVPPPPVATPSAPDSMVSTTASPDQPEAQEPAVPGPRAPLGDSRRHSGEGAALIRDLIQKAEELVDQRQLTTPKGDNALEVVHAIAALEAGHPAIPALKTRMVETYRVWGRNAERRSQWDLARLYYERALAVDGDDPTVRTLLASLDRRRKPSRSPAQPDDSPARTATVTSPEPDQEPPLPSLRP